MAEDVKEKEEKKELEEKEKSKEPSWFAKVPAMYKIAGIGVLVVMYLRVASGQGTTTSFWVWAAGVFAMWWALGKEGKSRLEDILTPKERDAIIRQEVTRMRNEGQIERFAEVFYGPNSGLQDHEALPLHYITELQVVEDGITEYKRALTFAEGSRRGIVTIQNNKGRFQGTETIPVISPIPKWVKRADKMDLDVDKILFGK